MTTERGQPDGAGVEEFQSLDRGDLARAAALHDVSLPSRRSARITAACGLAGRVYLTCV